MRPIHALRAAFLITCLMFAGHVHADVILSNLPGTPSGTGTNLGLGIDAVDRTKGVGLTMGGTAMDFQSVVALISNTTPASTLSGGIFSDVAGNPGALLAAFTPVPVPANTPPSNFTLTVPGTFTLAAGTSYWFVLDGPVTTNSLLWQSLAPNTAPTAAAGITFTGYRFSSNGGATWANSTIFNGVTVNAVIPEPGMLGAAGCAGLLLLRRRK
jgi:hypothetical protein